MIPKDAKKLFVSKFSSFGSDKFYDFLLNYAINRIVSNDELDKDYLKSKIIGLSPELELIDYHDRFLVLYRKEKKDIYLDIAKLFRRASHKIYRVLLKKDMTEKDNRFLSLVE